MKLYSFTGDINELKSIGYKFQKLYAKNYKTYNKNDIFMFVISKMVLEISNLKSEKQENFIDFILENKEKSNEFWYVDKIYPQYSYTNSPLFVMSSFGNILPVDKFYDIKFDFMKKISKLREKDQNNKITKEKLKNEIKKLEESHEGAVDGFYFHKEIVDQIIELNDLHSLEKIEIKKR